MRREEARPGAGEVLRTLGDAASELGSFVTTLVEEQPATALMAALAAGFIAGGGLFSPIGTRLTSGTIRATLGNVATLAALDLVRRRLEEGGRRRGTQSAVSD